MKSSSDTLENKRDENIEINHEDNSINDCGKENMSEIIIKSREQSKIVKSVTLLQNVNEYDICEKNDDEIDEIISDELEMNIEKLHLEVIENDNLLNEYENFVGIEKNAIKLHELPKINDSIEFDDEEQCKIIDKLLRGTNSLLNFDKETFENSQIKSAEKVDSIESLYEIEACNVPDNICEITGLDDNEKSFVYERLLCVEEAHDDVFLDEDISIVLNNSENRVDKLLKILGENIGSNDELDIINLIPGYQDVFHLKSEILGTTKIIKHVLVQTVKIRFALVTHIYVREVKCNNLTSILL
ncbi:hypothetical protein TKK_0014575 [Trichogramma kaykai]